MNRILLPISITKEKNTFLVYLQFFKIIKYFGNAIFDTLYNNKLTLDLKKRFLKQTSYINHLLPVPIILITLRLTSNMSSLLMSNII